MPDRLEDKVAIVTGGSAGIGLGIARVFASEGAKVVICARRSEVLDKAVKTIEDTGGQAIGVQCDVSNETQIKELINTAVEIFGKLDILINNAGAFGSRVTVEDLEESEWDRMFTRRVIVEIRIYQLIISLETYRNHQSGKKFRPFRAFSTD